LGSFQGEFEDLNRLPINSSVRNKLGSLKSALDGLDNGDPAGNNPVASDPMGV
jgi:hypothetical protein